MLSVSRYDQNLKLINKYLFGKEYDNDENTKLEKIKQFQEVLTQFVQDHEKTVNIDDIRQFINGQKQNLSEIGVKDPECRLLAVLLPIYENNNLKSVQDFLNLISEFDIKDTRIVFNIKYNICRCYVCSQNLTYDVFKKAVDDLLSCNYLQMKTFKNFIELCFKQDKDKTLQKGDCFNYIFKLLKERCHEGNIENICSVRYLLEMIIYTFGCGEIKLNDESILRCLLSLTKNDPNFGIGENDFKNLFKIFLSFNTKILEQIDFKNVCWVAQYAYFCISYINKLGSDYLENNSLELYIKAGPNNTLNLSQMNMVVDQSEPIVTFIRSFNMSDMLPEVRLLIASNFVHDDSVIKLVLPPDIIKNFIKNKDEVTNTNQWQFKYLWDFIMSQRNIFDSLVPKNHNDYELTNFFPTPKDLFAFYKKVKPNFFKNSDRQDNKFDQVTKMALDYNELEQYDRQKKIHFALFNCLSRYDSKQISDLIKQEKDNEDDLDPFINIAIWLVCARSYTFNKEQLQSFFPTIKDLIDFYIYKVPKQVRQEKSLSIFSFANWSCIAQDWDNYSKNINEYPSHAELFFKFFDGEMDFNEQDLRNTIYIYGMFNGFKTLQGFLDFYLKIYSSCNNMDKLKQTNNTRDSILDKIIYRFESGITSFLANTVANNSSYNFCVPLLINNIISNYLNLRDLSYIVQFLSKKNDLNPDLKDKLLKKIDDQVKEHIVVGLLGVSYGEPSSRYRYETDAFTYPNDFQTELKYVIEIMNSKDVLPETKKKIYDWAKDAIKQDEEKWQCVLEMYVYHIEKDKQPKKDIDLSGPSLFPTFIIEPLLNIIQQNPNNSNKNDKNNKYERLRYCSIDGHKNLTTLKSHQDDWHLADLKNSDELRNLNAQIDNLSTQINTLQNKLNKTEFKLDWILIIWLSLIGTIVLLGLRYYWDSSKNSLNNTKNTLSSRKLDLEKKIKEDCNKKKTDYEDSLSKAREEMKKWGTYKNSTDYIYNKHEEYCKGLKQIINTYERGKNLNQDIDISNSGDKISPLEEQQQENDIIIYEDEI